MTTKTTFFLVASAILAAAGLFMAVKGTVVGGVGCLVVGLLGGLMHLHRNRHG